MQKSKAWFGALKQSYSCVLGIVINILIFLTFWMLTIFPAAPGEWVPMWFPLALLCIGILMLVGVLFAIRDFLKQNRLLALVGFLLCCWPVLLATGNGIANWLTVHFGYS